MGSVQPIACFSVSHLAIVYVGCALVLFLFIHVIFPIHLTLFQALLTGEFDPKNFLEKVTAQDTSGNQLPPWKRMIVARQMAEKAYVEAQERRKVGYCGIGPHNGSMLTFRNTNSHRSGNTVIDIT